MPNPPLTSCDFSTFAPPFSLPKTAHGHGRHGRHGLLPAQPSRSGPQLPPACPGVVFGTYPGLVNMPKNYGKFMEV